MVVLCITIYRVCPLIFSLILNPYDLKLIMQQKQGRSCRGRHVLTVVPSHLFSTSDGCCVGAGLLLLTTLGISSASTLCEPAD